MPYFSWKVELVLEILFIAVEPSGSWLVKYFTYQTQFLNLLDNKSKNKIVTWQEQSKNMVVDTVVQSSYSVKQCILGC